jgi:hypothetical protein
MFSLSISITPEAINSIESDLTKSLSEIKASHRAEALARGLGFSTYASMLAASESGSGSIAMFNWIVADEYLKTHGFTAPMEPFFVAIGRVAIQQLLVREAQLTMDGIGISTLYGKKENDKERTTRFQGRRKEFLGDYAVKQFLRALAFVSCIRPIKSINEKINSYRLKHMAEKFACTYPDGHRLGPAYVANGALVAAAIQAGFQYQDDGTPTNVTFNMSQESIDDLHTQKSVQAA